jgi:transmembrane protein
MHADHTVVQIVAHVMIAFLFLYRGLDAIPRFGFHAGRIRDRGVPLPRFVMACGIATMIVGGLMVLVDFYAWIGAIMLVVFTIFANYLYHHFWTMEDRAQILNHRNFFCNNIAVMGGLALVIAG